MGHWSGRHCVPSGDSTGVYVWVEGGEGGEIWRLFCFLSFDCLLFSQSEIKVIQSENIYLFFVHEKHN